MKISTGIGEGIGSIAFFFTICWWLSDSFRELMFALVGTCN